ncbi:MAG: hypothetical protein IT352_07575 [Gemmatimonadales bacterium]|nr:hypothetical protein [Gemmatimonadales bacterium]
MAPTVPWTEPTRARAGDTWLWRRTFPEYPASEGWTPKYAIRGVDALLWDAAWAVASGEEWTITIPAASTLLLGAGRYEWAVILTGSGSYSGREHTIQTGVLEVLPDLETAAAGDRQTHTEKTIAILEAAIEGRLTADMEHYIINGRQVTRIPVRDLSRLLATYKARRYRERFGRVDVPVRVSL